MVGGGAWDVGSFGCCAVKEQSAMQAEPRGVPVNEKQVNDVVASIRAAWSRNQKKESEAVAIYIAAMEQSSRAAAIKKLDAREREKFVHALETAFAPIDSAFSLQRFLLRHALSAGQEANIKRLIQDPRAMSELFGAVSRHGSPCSRAKPSLDPQSRPPSVSYQLPQFNSPRDPIGRQGPANSQPRDSQRRGSQRMSGAPAHTRPDDGTPISRDAPNASHQRRSSCTGSNGDYDSSARLKSKARRHSSVSCNSAQRTSSSPMGRLSSSSSLEPKHASPSPIARPSSSAPKHRGASTPKPHKAHHSSSRSTSAPAPSNFYWQALGPPNAHKASASTVAISLGLET